MKKNFLKTKYAYHLLNSLPHNLNTTKKQKWLKNHHKIYKFSGFSKVQPLGKLTSWKDISSAWFALLEESFCYKYLCSVRKFSLSMKISCPLAENIYQTLQIVNYDNALQPMKSGHIWHKCCWARILGEALWASQITSDHKVGFHKFKWNRFSKWIYSPQVSTLTSCSSMDLIGLSEWTTSSCESVITCTSRLILRFYRSVVDQW